MSLPSRSDGFIKASERDAREWREVVAAIGQHVEDVIAPVHEGYADLPAIADDALREAAHALDRFDRAMSKIDSAPGGVGGKYKLERVVA